MLLILSNSEDVTADYLGTVLAHNGVGFLRLDTDTFLQHAELRYVTGSPAIRIDGDSYTPDRFTNVWYRRPESLRHPLITDSPEGRFVLDEWAESLEGFLAHIHASKWMNHPSRNVRASHKIEQLTCASSFGFHVPDTLVTQDPTALRAFLKKHADRVIAKPIASGHIRRSKNEPDSLIYTNRVLSTHLGDLDDLLACPTLFQELIEKRCDVRITIVDGEMHAVELTAHDSDGAQRCDIRRNNMDDVCYRTIEPPDRVRSLLARLIDFYGLRFAAVDMAVTTRSEWVFFEVNPNGQWAWLDLAGVTDIAGSFINAFRQS